MFSAEKACRSIERHAKPAGQTYIISPHRWPATRSPHLAGQQQVKHVEIKIRDTVVVIFFLDIGSSFEYPGQNGELFAAIEKRDSHSTTTDGSINDATRDGAELYLRISFVRMQLALIRILNQKFRTRDGAGFYRRTF